MRPRRTPDSNVVYVLPGGNEDRDLHVERGEFSNGDPYTISEWELTPAEREAVAIGGRIQLVMHTHLLPPMAMLAVLRPSTGDLLVVEGADATKGTAVLLPAQAERLRRWLEQSLVLLQLQAAQAEGDDLDKVQGAMAEMGDLLDELRPIEQKNPVAVLPSDPEGSG